MPEDVRVWGHDLFLCLDGRATVQYLQRQSPAPGDGGNHSTLPWTVKCLAPGGGEEWLRDDTGSGWTPLCPVELKLIAVGLTAARSDQAPFSVMDLVEIAGLFAVEVAEEVPGGRARRVSEPLASSPGARPHVREAHGVLLRLFLLSNTFKEMSAIDVPGGEDEHPAYTGHCSLADIARRGERLLDTRAGNILGGVGTERPERATGRMQVFLRNLAGAGASCPRTAYERQFATEADLYCRLWENLHRFPLTQVMLKLIDLRAPGLLRISMLSREYSFFSKSHSDVSCALVLFWLYSDYVESGGRSYVENDAKFAKVLGAHQSMVVQWEAMFEKAGTCARQSGTAADADDLEARALRQLGETFVNVDVLKSWAAILSREAGTPSAEAQIEKGYIAPLIGDAIPENCHDCNLGSRRRRRQDVLSRFGDDTPLVFLEGALRKAASLSSGVASRRPGPIARVAKRHRALDREGAQHRSVFAPVLPQQNADADPTNGVTDPGAATVGQNRRRGEEVGTGILTGATQSLAVGARRPALFYGFQALLNGVTEIPGLASESVFRTSVRVVMEPALVVGMRVAHFFSMLRRNHANCNGQLSQQSLIETPGQPGAPGCCRDGTACNIHEGGAHSRPRPTCPCESCLKQAMESTTGLVVATSNQDACTVMLPVQPVFQHIVVRLNGILGVPHSEGDACDVTTGGNEVCVFSFMDGLHPWSCDSNLRACDGGQRLGRGNRAPSLVSTKAYILALCAHVASRVRGGTTYGASSHLQHCLEYLNSAAASIISDAVNGSVSETDRAPIPYEFTARQMQLVLTLPGSDEIPMACREDVLSHDPSSDNRIAHEDLREGGTADRDTVLPGAQPPPFCVLAAYPVMERTRSSVATDYYAMVAGHERSLARGPAPDLTLLEVTVPVPGLHYQKTLARANETRPSRLSPSGNSYGGPSECLVLSDLAAITPRTLRAFYFLHSRQPYGFCAGVPME